MASPLHYTLQQSALILSVLSLSNTLHISNTLLQKHLVNTCRLSRLFPFTVVCHMFSVARKSFWQLFFLEWQPAASCCLGEVRFFPPSFFPPLHSVNCFDPYLHPATSVKLLVVATLITQSDRSAFPHVSSYRTRAWCETGGGGRTLAFWSSLSACGACPLQQNTLTAWFTTYRGVSTVDILIVNISAITQRAHCHVVLRMLSHSLVTWFSVFTVFFVCFFSFYLFIISLSF